MASGGNIIIGNNSGNSNNTNTCMTVEEDTAGHPTSPMAGSITYNNVEIHIGLFGGHIQMPDHKRARPLRLRKLMACIAAASIASVLALSIPTECRTERVEVYSISEVEETSSDQTKNPALISCENQMKQRRKRI